MSSLLISLLPGNLGAFRDEFAPDSLLQRGVKSELDSATAPRSCGPARCRAGRRVPRRSQNRPARRRAARRVQLVSPPAIAAATRRAGGPADLRLANMAQAGSCLGTYIRLPPGGYLTKKPLTRPVSRNPWVGGWKGTESPDNLPRVVNAGGNRKACARHVDLSEASSESRATPSARTRAIGSPTARKSWPPEIVLSSRSRRHRRAATSSRGSGRSGRPCERNLAVGHP